MCPFNGTHDLVLLDALDQVREGMQESKFQKGEVEVGGLIPLAMPRHFQPLSCSQEQKKKKKNSFLGFLFQLRGCDILCWRVFRWTSSEPLIERIYLLVS